MLPFALIFGAIGLVAQGVGSLVQANGAQKQADASVRAEKLRERQMKLESARQRRQSIRNMLAARSAAMIAAQAKGGQGGSGESGGLAQITNQGAENVLGINQAQTIGQGIFRANADIARAGGQVAWGSALSQLGRDVASLKIG